MDYASAYCKLVELLDKKSGEQELEGMVDIVPHCMK